VREAFIRWRVTSGVLQDDVVRSTRDAIGAKRHAMTWLCWFIGIILIAVGLAVLVRGHRKLGLIYVGIGVLMGPGLGSLVF
jgi:hypothetical protein